MSSPKDCIFLRPMPSVFVRVNRQITADPQPEVTGTVSRYRGSLPDTVIITIEGNDYAASVSPGGPGGLWTVAQGTIAPPLAEGIYEVLATSTWGSVVITDRTTFELILATVDPILWDDASFSSFLWDNDASLDAIVWDN